MAEKTVKIRTLFEQQQRLIDNSPLTRAQYMTYTDGLQAIASFIDEKLGELESFKEQPDKEPKH
jgi:hypothetical protein